MSTSEIKIKVIDGSIYLNNSETELSNNFFDTKITDKNINLSILTEKLSSNTISEVDHLSMPRNISVSNSMTGNTSTGFDGSANANIAVTSLNANKLSGSLSDSVTINLESISGTVSEATHSSNSDKLSNARTIALSGTDISGTATSFDGSTNISIPTTLSNTGVTSGTYGSGLDQQNKIKIPQIQIDNKGRILSANNIETAVNPDSTIDWSDITNKPTTLSGYGIADPNEASISQNTVYIGGNSINVISLPLTLNDANMVSGILNKSNGGTGYNNLNSLKSELGIPNSNIIIMKAFFRREPYWVVYNSEDPHEEISRTRIQDLYDQGYDVNELYEYKSEWEDIYWDTSSISGPISLELKISTIGNKVPKFVIGSYVITQRINSVYQIKYFPVNEIIGTTIKFGNIYGEMNEGGMYGNGSALGIITDGSYEGWSWEPYSRQPYYNEFSNKGVIRYNTYHDPIHSIPYTPYYQLYFNVDNRIFGYQPVNTYPRYNKKKDLNKLYSYEVYLSIGYM